MTMHKIVNGIEQPLSEEDISQFAEDALLEDDFAWSRVRGDRNARLAASDWTQLPDCPLTNVQQAEWAVYRQALRDITNQTDPFNIVWPQEPE
jgi:hypothetical protein